MISHLGTGPRCDLANHSPPDGLMILVPLPLIAPGPRLCRWESHSSLACTRKDMAKSPPANLFPLGYKRTCPYRNRQRSTKTSSASWSVEMEPRP